MEAGGAPSKLEVEHYVEAVRPAVERLGAVDRELRDLIEEGWPTKLRGHNGDRFARLADAGAEVESRVRAVAPDDPRLAAAHTNLRELADAYARVTAMAGDVEGIARDDERNRQLLEAKADADREVGEWVEPMRALAAETGADLTPLASAIQTRERSFGERLGRFAMRLVRPFAPIAPLSARRLFVAPFLPPYGPLSPPSVWAFTGAAGRVLNRIPLLGWILTLYVLFAGLSLAALYYLVLLTWWVVAGVWISLIATALGRGRRPATLTGAG